MSNGTDKMNAANELRTFANRFRATLAVADDMEKLGSIENAIGEAEAKLSSVKVERDRISADFDSAKSEVANARGKADGIVADANAKANAIIEAAQGRADDVVKEAQRTAEAKAAAAKVASDAVAVKVTKQREILAGLNAEIGDAETRLTAARNEIESIRKRL